MDVATLAPGTLPSIVVRAILGGGRLAVGDSVIAIGNLLGLTRTTTTGVVSGLDRTERNQDGTTLSGLIQFDAAVNPGSSGGPLLNAAGQVIGFGFAVPIGAASRPVAAPGLPSSDRARKDRGRNMQTQPHAAPAGPGANPVEQILYEVKKTIVGQDALLERMLVALLSRGHILVEGVPGLAKTLAVKSLAGAVGGQFNATKGEP